MFIIVAIFVMLLLGTMGLMFYIFDEDYFN